MQLVDARPTSLIVSPMATATSTAVEAAIPTISERRGGDREERQRHQSEKPGACDVSERPAQEEALGEQEERRRAESEDREAERRLVVGMGDRELVTDGDPEQRDHYQGQRPGALQPTVPASSAVSAAWAPIPSMRWK